MERMLPRNALAVAVVAGAAEGQRVAVAAATAAAVAAALAVVEAPWVFGMRDHDANHGDILLVDDDPDLLKLISLPAYLGGLSRAPPMAAKLRSQQSVARPSAVITDLHSRGH